MANLLHRAEASVRSFYIFNSNYGQNEGQEAEKIFYYHPKDIELNSKIKDVGLSEAIISFIRTFSDNNGCEEVHTMKTNQLFYEAERDFWIVLSLNVPKELCSKDNVEYESYHNSELCDAYYRRILEHTYNLFRLRYGSFDRILNCVTNHTNNSNCNATEKMLQLKRKLEDFYDEFIGNLILPNSNVIQYIRSMQYLSLDKALFLKVHNYINIIKGTFPLIIDALFLYNDTLVCSGGKFQPVELYTIYNHVLNTLSRDNNDSNSNSICNNLDQSTLQDVYVTYNNTLMPIKLLIYHINSASLCLFFNEVNSDVERLKDTCERLNSSNVNAQLNILANEIGDRVKALAKLSSLQQQSNMNDMEIMSPKYLFVNEQTLQHLTNIIYIRAIPNSCTNANLNLIPPYIMRTLIDLASASFGLSPYKADIQNICTPPFEETIVKSTSDFWIIKRQYNWRQFYVIIFSKKSTLLDVTAEAERVFQQYIKDDVFFDK